MKRKVVSTHKKVRADLTDGSTVQGYVKYPKIGDDSGLILLNEQGQNQTIPWKLLKLLWFVKDWEEAPPALKDLSFNRRPRTQGLWVRLQFLDDAQLEGILVNDLLQLNPYGFFLSPPAHNGNSYTIFVPRTILRSAEILSVIGGSAGLGRRKRPAPPPEQTRLFES